MATFDRAAALSLSGLRFKVAGVASGYAVALDGPPDGTRPPSLAVPLSVLVSSASALNTDVQIQVSISAGFGTTVYSNTLTDRADGIHSVTVSGLTNKTTYYWRARAAETGTVGWSAWTPTWTVFPDLDAGKAFGYVNENVGASLTPDPDATGYVLENVGVEITTKSVGFAQVAANYGVEITLTGLGFGYAHYGDVNTLPPSPHVWFLKPAAGREGDGIGIYCFGVGDLVGTWAGSVELYYGPALGWVAVPVVSWQTFPPTADAYTAARLLDPSIPHIDMQHTVIEIVVPAGALPPGYPVRVRTVTP